jgi:anti-sigma factor RsiW
LTDPCSSVARLLGAYVDGRLDTAKTLEVDDHLTICETCSERIALDRAIRGSLKKTTKTSASDEMKERMLAAMAAESTREQRREDQPQGRGMLRHWRTMIPMASAAAIALAWGVAAKQPVVTTSDTMGAGFVNDDLLRQFVAVHSHPMRPEASDPSMVRQFERDVGVPVRFPQKLHKNARFVGGRLLPTANGERAALLQYEVAQSNGNVQRVSIFVYDPRRVTVGSKNLAPRAVGTAQVQVGQENGVSVAVTQHGQAGYLVASDLDQDSSAKLVAAVDSE